MNRDLAAITATTADAVARLATAAQRALTGRVIWTPADAAAAVHAELQTFWPEVTPAAARDMLCEAARLALANGVTGVPEPVASWAAKAMLSAVHRSQGPGLWPGHLSPADLASAMAFDEGTDAEVLQALSVLLALAYTPGASCWRPA